MDQPDQGASRAVDYFYSLVSPWAYIGHAAFTDIRRRHGLGVRHRPVSLGTVFPASGGLPLAQRHPLRQRYRMLELQRWRERRGLRFTLQPRFWPFDATLADRIVVALVRDGADPDAFLTAAFPAVWEREHDLADPVVLSDLLRAGGFDADRILALARSEAVGEIYARNALDALDAGVFGSPAYRWAGEVFWGQDRLDLLDDALASGRAPFTA